MSVILFASLVMAILGAAILGWFLRAKLTGEFDVLDIREMKRHSGD